MRTWALATVARDGVPLGWLPLVLDQRSDAVEFAVFLPVRVSLWAATAISAALEFAAGEGHGRLYLTYHTRFC